MYKYLILFLISFNVSAQDTLDTPYIRFREHEWTKFIKGADFPARITGNGYQQFVFEPPDTATYIYEINRRKKVWNVVYDSATVEYNNNHSSIAYSSGWLLGSGQVKFFNGDFQYGSTPIVTRTATFTHTSDKPIKIRFWSERFSGHGKYTINGQEIDAGASPFGSDKDRGKASWSSAMLPPGTHTVTITTSAQMVVDRFTVTTYTPR